MANSKNTKLFCNTPYKKWLAVLCLMVVIMVVWIIVGFDGDRAKSNRGKIAHESKVIEHNLMGGNETNDYLLDQVHMAKLQESYSDVALQVREVTVNISASRNMGNGNNGGLAFADPFGQTQPNNQPQGGQPLPDNSPIIGVKATAPPITPDAVMLHKFKGVCSNCHIINQQTKAGNVAAQPQGRASVGSGIIIDSAGYILTNYHIINNATDIMVTTANGHKYRADVNYTDVVGDLCILKVNSPTPFPAASLGDSSLAQEGDIVLAVGSPFGLNQTVTAGIISNTDVSIPIGGKPFTGLLQTDAAINRGSSGGPLVNIKGEVIGVNTAIYSMTGDFTGVGFAIPVNRAKEAFVSVPSLNSMAVNMVDLNVGEVITVAMQPGTSETWFGVEVTEIDPIMAEQFALHNKSGVMVNRVFAESPAALSGVKRGDVISKINGRRITDGNKFQKITSLLTPGESINLQLKRNNKPVVLTATLNTRPAGVLQPKGNRAAGAGPAELEWAGMEVVAITPQLAKTFGIRKGEQGVVALEVEGMAAASGVMRGDVIKSINRTKVNNMADFMSVTANTSFVDGVLFDISRQGDPLFITM